jgi:hypothetical protein
MLHRMGHSNMRATEPQQNQGLQRRRESKECAHGAETTGGSAEITVFAPWVRTGLKSPGAPNDEPSLTTNPLIINTLSTQVRGGAHVASSAARAERPSQAPVDRLNVAGGPNVGREANRIAGGLGNGDEPDPQRFGGIEHRAGQGRAAGVIEKNGGFRLEYEYQGEGDAHVVMGIAGPVDGSLTQEAFDAEDRDGLGARRRPSAKDLDEIWGMRTPEKDGAQYG